MCGVDRTKVGKFATEITFGAFQNEEGDLLAHNRLSHKDITLDVKCHTTIYQY